MDSAKSSDKLFTDPEGIPLTFQIISSDGNADEYRQKIITHGGAVINDINQLNDRQKSHLIRLSNKPIDSLTFSTSFIDESIRRNEVLSLEIFGQVPDRKRKVDEIDITDSLTADAVNAVAQAEADSMGYFTHNEKYANGIKKPNLRKKTSKFNAEKDAFIMEQVRLKPRFRTSHIFYDQLAKSSILQGHTGHSVRSRCRVHLLPKIEYVYKTDESGNLILDDHGNKIRVPLDDVPNTLKNRFSAEEDYLLCTEVLKYVLSGPKNLPRDEHGFVDEKQISVGISFFDDFTRKYPNHSSPSWRDRFRKFAKSYGVQKYIHDYEENVRNNRIPEPMKNLTRRKVRKRDAPEQYVNAADDEDEDDLAEEQRKLHQVARAAALDEEIGEVKSSNIDEALREVDSNRKKEQEALAELESESDAEPENSFLVPESQANIIAYLPQNVKTIDILDDKFFQYDEKKFNKKLVRIIRELSENEESDKDGEYIYTHFEKLGVKPVFTSHVLMCSSSNATRIKSYFKKILKRLKRVSEGIKEEDLYGLLLVNNKDGLWSPHLDNLLMEGKLDELKQIQSDHSISARVQFLKNNGKF